MRLGWVLGVVVGWEEGEEGRSSCWGFCVGIYLWEGVLFWGESCLVGLEEVCVK